MVRALVHLRTALWAAAVTLTVVVLFFRPVVLTGLGGRSSGQPGSSGITGGTTSAFVSGISFSCGSLMTSLADPPPFFPVPSGLPAGAATAFRSANTTFEGACTSRGGRDLVDLVGTVLVMAVGGAALPALATASSRRRLTPAA